VNSKKTLLGKSLVITRSLEQSEPLFSELVKMGAKVISIPLITIADPIDGGKGLEEKVKNFDSYKWVIVTSPNGAIRLLEKVKVFGKNHWPRIAVIGGSTAEVFKQSGITVDLIPEKTFSEGFLEVFPNPKEEDNKVLLVQAESARSLLYKGLIDAGWSVEKTVAYRNINTEVETKLLLEAKNADAIIFTASSAVNRYHELMGSSQPINAVCIGPITGESARILGWKVFEAREQSVKDLIEAVKQWAGS
tara:strand:- start:6168 stop:6914 length:747 start_codon:yes stop_codon:yes gene_type:complete